MKPLIKWPGGKSREIKNIGGLIPESFDRYIEPFVGGGALFFHLEHSNNAINDINKDLMQFYRMVREQNVLFIESLHDIADDWDRLGEIVDPFVDPFVELKNRFLQSSVIPKIGDMKKVYFKDCLYSLDKVRVREDLQTFLLKSLHSKIIRIAQLEKNHDRPMTDRWTYRDHVETAIRSAYYTLLRDQPPESLHPISVFFFIREFAFGSMFRYNSKGKFNIPYGGIAYNRKSFRKKIELIKSRRTIDLLNNTEICNDDYISFLKRIDLTPNDFIFFDPPYDSEFTEYGQAPFIRNDHQFLSQIFADLKAKAMIVIGNSPFVARIYDSAKQKNSNISIRKYPKKYAYNVRGRNERGATHLVITNYPI